MGFVEKYRSAGVVSGGTLVGQVSERLVVIIDDLISSGGTLVRAARACRDAGASRVLAAASHGLFVADASQTLSDPAIDEIVVTDSVAPFRLGADWSGRLSIVDTAVLFGDAIARLHEGRSLTVLTGEWADTADHPQGATVGDWSSCLEPDWGRTRKSRMFLAFKVTRSSYGHAAVQAPGSGWRARAMVQGLQCRGRRHARWRAGRARRR